MKKYFILIVVVAVAVAINVITWLWLASDDGGLRVELLK